MFEETQRFRQPWLWTIVLGTTVMTVLALAFDGQYISGLMALAVMALTAGFLYAVRLDTRIDEDEISIRLFPFHISSRTLSYDEIEDLSVERYSPLREFGGWGLRWRPGKRAYNVSGNQGLRIKKKDGKEIVIGTQRPEELEQVVEKL
ncbi:hypothetical protein [Candidatus Nanohalococcus occultus]|uniref:Membrane protein n=1 Tax=Candidatus Nanohalococcus occultus TaxID=2978047 RepID=A0ABY8CFY1_9ARCH|nr:putative membrane protein [Candidatus Nanohaloarchaeota archaeon SVXNc]